MKKNNKGYSLVELVITLAIFSIIMLAIIMMMQTSMESYKDGLFETTMQEEAQIVANQVGDLLVDAKAFNSSSGSTGSKSYSFTGPEGSFTLSQEGKNLLLNGDLLTDQLDVSDGFSIEGLDKRVSGDTTTVYDNAVVVRVNINYQDRTYELKKDVYFRNNIEDNGLATDAEYYPFDASHGPSKVGGSGGSTDKLATVLRYSPYDVSAEYDLIADAELSTAAQSVFELDISNNNTVNAANIGSLDAKHVKVKVNETYQKKSGFSFGTPDGSEDYYIEGKNSKGEDIKVTLKSAPVSFDSGAGIFNHYYENDVNENGYPTHVDVKGIHINDALKNGLKIKYVETLTRGATKIGETSQVEMAKCDSTIANQANSSSQLSPLDYYLATNPDPVNGALVITPKNGQKYSQKDSVKSLSNDAGDQKLTIKFYMDDGTGYSEMTGLQLNYKFFVTGNSYEHAY